MLSNISTLSCFRAVVILDVPSCQGSAKPAYPHGCAAAVGGCATAASSVGVTHGWMAVMEVCASAQWLRINMQDVAEMELQIIVIQ